MGEPRASKTAREVKFSEAMRTMDSRWRWISFFYVYFVRIIVVRMRKHAAGLTMIAATPGSVSTRDFSRSYALSVWLHYFLRALNRALTSWWDFDSAYVGIGVDPIL
jgi:hypothetical protein